jgi:WD40 repeat protein
MLAPPSADRTIRLRDAGSGECMRTLIGHDDMAFAVAFDERGQMLASAGLDKNVMLWSTVRSEFLRNLGTHHHGAFTVAFNPGNGTVLSSVAETIRTSGFGIR